MPKKLKNKARLDKFYHHSKRALGYFGRVLHKLIQLNQIIKYNFLQKANCAGLNVLQVAENFMPIKFEDWIGSLK